MSKQVEMLKKKKNCALTHCGWGLGENQEREKGGERERGAKGNTEKSRLENLKKKLRKPDTENEKLSVKGYYSRKMNEIIEWEKGQHPEETPFKREVIRKQTALRKIKQKMRKERYDKSFTGADEGRRSDLHPFHEKEIMLVIIGEERGGKNRGENDRAVYGGVCKE